VIRADDIRRGDCSLVSGAVFDTNSTLLVWIAILFFINNYGAG